MCRETKFVSYNDLIKRKVKMPSFLKEQCVKYEILPEEFFNKQNHKGAKSISFFLSTINYLLMQKYCKLQGLDFFIAASSLQDVKKLVFLNENIDSVRYRDYLDLLRK